jgi:outer membrane protein assembly factor BamD
MNCDFSAPPSPFRRSALISIASALRLAVVAALVLPVAACGGFDPFSLFGGEKYVTKIDPEVPPDTGYDQGLARLAKGDSEGAAKAFADVDKQYPNSQWSRKGLLMTTYAQYNSGQYDDAIASANRYIGLYPDTPDTAYAMYLAGMSMYNEIPDISRDQERAQKALDMFTKLVEKFPKSEYVDDTKYKIQVVRDQLAGKEMSIGRYYLTRHNYAGAINRFHEVLAKYQTTRHTEEALYRLTEAYLGLGISDEAQTAAAVLGHNFPDSDWYHDAYNLLQGGGLKPNENKGSWISKIFQKVGLG